MSQKSVKISVVLPFCDRHEFLEGILGDLAAQSLKDIEILCIDDGSTDDSARIVARYARDSRFIYQKVGEKPSGSASKPRNVGLELASGEYIWFVDSDDRVDTKACEFLYHTARAYDLDVLEFAGNSFITQENELKFTDFTSFTHNRKDLGRIMDGKTYIEQVMCRYLRPAPFFRIIRRALLADVRFIEGYVVEDVHFAPISVYHARKIMAINYAPYMILRNNETSVSRGHHKPFYFLSYVKILGHLSDFVVAYRARAVLRWLVIYQCYFEAAFYDFSRHFGQSEQILPIRAHKIALKSKLKAAIRTAEPNILRRVAYRALILAFELKIVLKSYKSLKKWLRSR